MKRKSRGRKILISIICLVLVAAIGAGAWFYVGNSNAEPVNVYPFMYLGMTEYWGDSQESYGFVQTDGVQTVYLSNTQTVTEVLVQMGQEVKKGDVLMTFDTTLSDLALERKRLDVEKLKLQLQDAKERLWEINSMRPMVIPQPSDDPEEDVDLGEVLTEAYKISHNSDFDGSTADLALICWLNSATSVDESILDALIAKASEYQTINAAKEPEQEEKPASSPSPMPTEETQGPTEAPTDPTEAPTDPTEAPTDPTDAPTDPTEAPMDPTEAPTDPTEAPTDPTEAPTDPTEAPTDPTEAPTDPTEAPTDPTEAPTDPTEPSEDPSEPTEPSEPEEVEVSKFYVVFKVTEGNQALAAKTAWQGIYVIRSEDTGDYSFKFFDATLVQDHMLAPDEEAEEAPEIDYGSGFTAAQIAEMRAQQEKTIKDLEFSIKMAEADYKIAQTEVTDGNVYAQIDGVVVSLISADEAQMMQMPMLKVSAGGGFYVEGTVSELDRDNMEIGQEVTINDWNTGMTYIGHVESLGDYPSADGYWNGMGNPTASYYPFRVFVDESADLQSGSYVNITFSSGSTEHGVYLENPFIRTEGGRSYVYLRGEDGLLEQRYVTTGKSLWGSYMEILEGVTEEDLIAFPYGKNVKPGAETVESDISALYE